MSYYAFIGAIETGLVFALVALGSFLTFRVLDFPDLTVEGSFPLGASVAATMISGGVNCWVAVGAAILAGILSGCVTAAICLQFRVMAILSGILTSIALYSINIRIMGSANISLLGVETVYGTIQRLGISSFYAPVTLLFALMVLAKLLLDQFLATGFGLGLRAAGANPRMARANGVHVGGMIYLGLGLANGLTALAGALFAQMMGAADVAMGTGVIVIALAAVIGGCALFPFRSMPGMMLACIIGSVLYRLAVGLALDSNTLGFMASDVNIVTAILVVAALYLPTRVRKLRRP
jgi:putative tryptophan/tyrosine transport system permease protein